MVSSYQQKTPCSFFCCSKMRLPRICRSLINALFLDHAMSVYELWIDLEMNYVLCLGRVRTTTRVWRWDQTRTGATLTSTPSAGHSSPPSSSSHSTIGRTSTTWCVNGSSHHIPALYFFPKLVPVPCNASFRKWKSLLDNPIRL